MNIFIQAFSRAFKELFHEITVDQAMHSVDGWALASSRTYFMLRRSSDFLMPSSFFYSNNCSDDVLSKNWWLCTVPDPPIP
jgi:hypothetical protein